MIEDDLVVMVLMVGGGSSCEVLMVVKYRCRHVVISVVRGLQIKRGGVFACLGITMCNTLSSQCIEIEEHAGTIKVF